MSERMMYPKQLFDELWKLNEFQFLLYDNSFHKDELWDFKINNADLDDIFYISKGVSKLDGIDVVLSYSKEANHGTGQQILTEISEDCLTEYGLNSLLYSMRFQANKFKIEHPEIKKEHYYKTSIEFLKSNDVGLLYYFLLDSDNSHRVTLQEWYNSRKTFTEFMSDKIGWRVDEEIIDYFYESLPPIWDTDYMACSEPYDFCPRTGRDRFISFIYYNDEPYFQGYITKDHLKAWKTVKPRIEKEKSEIKEDTNDL